MKLEQQVVSLELAQKLKELGVKESSSFYWNKKKNEEWKVILSTQTDYGLYDEHSGELVPTWSVAELGEMSLSDCLSRKTRSVEFPWRCERESTGGYITASGADTEADARAKMLVYLLENNLVSLTP